MATIFPSNPQTNDEYQGYRFNGTQWEIIGIDLTADYAELTSGYVSDTVIPATIARVDDVNTSLEDYILLTEKGEPLGVAELDASGYVPAAQLNLDLLPSQTGNDGKFLSTDGSIASWETVDALPAQSTHNGKFLTTDGSVASWATVDALPSQSGNGTKILTTDGTSASWATQRLYRTGYVSTTSATTDLDNCFNSTYRNYRVIIQGTGGGIATIQFINSGLTSGYTAGQIDSSSSYTTASWYVNVADQWGVSTINGTYSYWRLSALGGAFILDIVNPYLDGISTWATMTCAYAGGPYALWGGYSAPARSYRGLRLGTSSFNGTIEVYGY